MDNKNVVFLHTVEVYSTITINKIMSFSGKWMELENNMISEISQTQKVKVVFSHIWKLERI